MRWFAAARHFNSNFDLMEFLKTDLISYSLGNSQKRIQSYPVFWYEYCQISHLIERKDSSNLKMLDEGYKIKQT